MLFARDENQPPEPIDSTVCKRLFCSPGPSKAKNDDIDSILKPVRRICMDSPPPAMAQLLDNTITLGKKRQHRSPMIANFRQRKVSRVLQLKDSDKVPETVCPKTVSSLFKRMAINDQVERLSEITDANTNCPSLTAQVVRSLLQRPGRYGFSDVLIIDARYSYEYDGGHITGAHNVTEPEQAEKLLLNSNPLNGLKTAIVFYCEFSSERGPRMFRHVRDKDRRAHLHVYPNISLPNMFVLQGGYKVFVKDHGDMCSPESGYVPMLHPNFDDQLKQCRIRCQTAWGLHKMHTRLSMPACDDGVEGMEH